MLPITFGEFTTDIEVTLDNGVITGLTFISDIEEKLHNELSHGILISSKSSHQIMSEIYKELIGKPIPYKVSLFSDNK
jgi:hypothetical protein